MAPEKNKRIVFKAFLKGPFVPGETAVFDDSQTIDVDNVPLNGGVVLKTLLLAIEPHATTKMRPGRPMSHQIGDVVQGNGIGVVVRSENPAFQVGDHLRGYFLPFSEYAVLETTEGFSKIENKHGLPWSVFLGIAGMPGAAAYTGWKAYAHAKKGEVAFVTSGAGTVGSLVIQLAKRDGMKVIASTGSDEKVRFLKELGADVAFNYKTTSTSGILEKEGPINLFWDNVGGEALEAALDAAAKHARFIECGMLSSYAGDFYPVRNLMNIVTKEISVNGFLHASLAKYMGSFEEEVPELVASEELLYREDIIKGLENAEMALGSFLQGAFTGKGIIEVAQE